MSILHACKANSYRRVLHSPACLFHDLLALPCMSNFSDILPTISDMHLPAQMSGVTYYTEQ
jgi:hypothetical protein